MFVRFYKRYGAWKPGRVYKIGPGLADALVNRYKRAEYVEPNSGTDDSADTTDVEPISLPDAMTHLSASNDQGQEVARKLAAARDDAERWIRRTLRSTVTRTAIYRAWQVEYKLPYPPLQSVTSVTYYDTAESWETVSTDDYEVVVPTEGVGRVLFNRGYNFPELSDLQRGQRVKIAYVSGWGSRDAVPPGAVSAIEKLLWNLWEDEGDIASDRREDDAKLILDNVGFGFYA